MRRSSGDGPTWFGPDVVGGRLAREFEPSSQAIRTWVAQAGRDAGERSDGLRTEERDELRRCAGRTGACAKSERYWQKQRPGSRGRPDPGDLPFMSANQARFRVATMAQCSASPRAGTTRGVVAPSARARALPAPRLASRRPAAVEGYDVLLGFTPLTEGGVAVSRKRVARVMRSVGVAGVSRRRGPRTTRRNAQARPAPDRVERRFEVAEPALGRRHHLRPDPGRLPVPGHRPRRVQPARRRLGHGGASSHRAGGRGAGGWPWTNGGRSRSSITPIKVASTPRWPSALAAGNGASPVDGFGRRLLR